MAVESQAPETKEFMSGPKERLMTSPVCPLKVRVCCPVSMSQRPLHIYIHGERTETDDYFWEKTTINWVVYLSLHSINSSLVS